MEVQYLPYIRPIFEAYVREYPNKIWPYVVQYLHFRTLKFPLMILYKIVYEASLKLLEHQPSDINMDDSTCMNGFV